MAIVIPDLLVIALVAFLAAGLANLMLHIISAKFIYGSKWFAERVATKFMSAPFVKMMTGKLLKKIVNGIADALSKIEMPDMDDLVDKIPDSIKDKLPAGVLDKLEGGDIGDLGDSLMGMIPGMGGKKPGGLTGIFQLLEMLKGLGGMGGGGEGSGGGGGGGYNPGG